MKYFALVEFYKGRAATIYSVLFNGEQDNETDKFLDAFYETHKEDIDEISILIRRSADLRGMKDNYCRASEGKITDSVIALPGKHVEDITGITRTSPPELRLYALRLSINTIVLYSGGIKPAGLHTYQEVPELGRIVKELQEIEGRILERIMPPNREIRYKGNDLIGNLKFEID